MVQLSGNGRQGKVSFRLTTDWVLGQFSGKGGKAEKEYRQFVSWGIGKPTIWTEVRGQTFLMDMYCTSISRVVNAKK
jgi:hypothetical protein